MKIFGRATDSSGPRLGEQILLSLLSLGLLFSTLPQDVSAYQDNQNGGQHATAQSQQQGAPYVQQTPEQLQQLVAPIALYPDSLVAQILAASTFPEQVVEADRWVQAHPDLTGKALTGAVDQQPWDPSVKALTSFPSVLGNMDKNLSWTSSLGDACYNQQQDVTDAIQVMRQRAQAAGNLQSNAQQTVTTQDSTIAIESANPEVVYVPGYDSSVVYYETAVVAFAAAVIITCDVYEWCWGYWGYDWHHHYGYYHHERYYSRSRRYEREVAEHERGIAQGERGVAERERGVAQGERGVAEGERSQAARGYGEARGATGTRSGPFTSYGSGGEEKGFSAQGQRSFGGGGFPGGAAPHGPPPLPPGHHR